MREKFGMEPYQPTLKELESIRQKLIRQIEEAEKLFPDDCNGKELITSRSALRSLEEEIRNAQEREVA
jgi:hypothetical protein